VVQEAAAGQKVSRLYLYLDMWHIMRGRPDSATRWTRLAGEHFFEWSGWVKHEYAGIIEAI
jgi:hypothetical protein